MARPVTPPAWGNAAAWLEVWRAARERFEAATGPEIDRAIHELAAAEAGLTAALRAAKAVAS